MRRERKHRLPGGRRRAHRGCRRSGSAASELIAQHSGRRPHRAELARGHRGRVHRARRERAEAAVGVEEHTFRRDVTQRRTDPVADLAHALDRVGARVHHAEPELLPAGRNDFAGARGRVLEHQLAHRQIARVKTLITQLGQRDARLPLKERCAEALSRDVGDDAEAVRKQAELEAAMAAVEALILDTFLGGGAKGAAGSGGGPR